MNKKNLIIGLFFRWMKNVFPFHFLPSLPPNIEKWRNLVLSEHAHGLMTGLWSCELEIPVPERGISNVSKISKLIHWYSEGLLKH